MYQLLNIILYDKKIEFCLNLCYYVNYKLKIYGQKIFSY